MDFIIKYNSKLKDSIKIKYCDNLNLIILEDNTVYVEKLEHLDYIELTNSSQTQIAIGDVIRNEFQGDGLSNSKGLFYLLTLTEQNKILQIMPDEHGLLPIYFMEHGDYILVSSSYMALVSKLINKTPNLDFYAELALLYTQLNRATYYKKIKRLEYGEIIELNKTLNITRERRFYDFFTSSPKSFKSSINDIAHKFIEISKSYVQDPCAISLTGGFDGRTITGCAHHHNSDFINFSYGRKGNGDVDNPISIANQLGLTYKLIELEQDYVDSEYIQCVESYIKYSGGFNGFHYPQSLHYAKLIGSERSIIVTGYLGSEILANAKGSDDEINAQSVIDFLKIGSTRINPANSLRSILTKLGIIQNPSSITNTLEKMAVYFTTLPKHLTINQKLAVFSFENTHRNTFGVWIYNAMHYAKVRVPFLDKEFLEAISQTMVSQFYRDFLENNPIKRVYGQMLYPVILNKVWPELNAINSSKGYPPSDILTMKGRFKIALKRLIKSNDFPEKHGLDKMSTISGAISYLEKLNIADIYLNVKKDLLLKFMRENPINRSLGFLALSKIESKRLLNS